MHRIPGPARHTTNPCPGGPDWHTACATLPGTGRPSTPITIDHPPLPPLPPAHPPPHHRPPPPRPPPRAGPPPPPHHHRRRAGGGPATGRPGMTQRPTAPR